MLDICETKIPKVGQQKKKASEKFNTSCKFAVAFEKWISHQNQIDRENNNKV